MGKCARLYPLEILSRKWSYLVLRTLREPMTFSELQRELQFITNHILTRELRLLQEEKLISHREKYYLLPAGRALYEAIEPIVAWSVKYADAPECPSSKKCSACLHYPEIMGAKYVQVGVKQH